MAVRKGDKVKVDYEGRLESGEIFDSSSHGDHSHPLEFEVGSGQVIKGFDEALIEMDIGDEKEITITPEEGYGKAREEMIKDIPRKALPSGQEPKEGMTLVMKTPDGNEFPAKIIEITKDKIKVDLNHPLAGKTLIFKIKLISIKQ